MAKHDLEVIQSEGLAAAKIVNPLLKRKMVKSRKFKTVGWVAIWSGATTFTYWWTHRFKERALTEASAEIEAIMDSKKIKIPY